MPIDTMHSDLKPGALDYSGLPVLHLFPHFQSLGGVESVLALHLANDPRVNVQSDLVIYSDSPGQSRERLHCLGLSFDESVAKIGRKLEAVTHSRRDRAAIYHLPFGMRYFSPHDHSRRRILVIHTKSPDMEEVLQRNSMFLDGILGVSSEIRDAVKAVLPNFPQDRISDVHCPIDPPAGERSLEELSTPIRLGFSGRLTVLQKRIDRIPEFCQRLQRSGIPFVFDVLGDGSDRSLLASHALAQQYRLHGTLRGAPYWEQMGQMDCVLFFSDYEGTPLALLEALSLGVIPIYPRINTGGDKYVERVDANLLYSPGDIDAAVNVIRQLKSYPPERIHALRERCRRAAVDHSLSNYLTEVFGFTERLWKLPRISTSSPGLPLKLLKFLNPRQLASLRSFPANLKGKS
jgi:glycosyltransferase involved in cell wall biosynthesis